VDAAIIKARQLDVTVCVAVCDRLGSLIALNRMDGAYETINRYSVGKAVVSAGTGLPSGDVVGIVDHPPVGTAVAEGFPAIRIRGGLPIRRGGAVEGGCGVAGALSPEQDEECARAGIAAFNATTTVNERSSVTTLASAPKTASAQESSMTDREIRAALNQHWAASDANDFELEHQICREDAVLEYPQSGERIRVNQQRKLRGIARTLAYALGSQQLHSFFVRWERITRERSSVTRMMLLFFD
jgi:uncharacterized protein GlcG (DUF336 family)